MSESETPSTNIPFIAEQSALQQWIELTQRQPHKGPRPRCAIDLEADSLHSYREKVCLVQLNWEGLIALVDPFSLDLHPLLAALNNADIWVHGGDYDLALLQKGYRWLPQRYFDTQIATRLCGAKDFGLAATVLQWLDIKLNKVGQKADWGKRPLPQSLLTYAVDDVRHLLTIADLLTAELHRLKRTEWFLQSCAAQVNAVANRPDKDDDEIWRINGWGRLPHESLIALKAIWYWRDEEAKRRDRPAFKILNTELMLEIAYNATAEAPPLRLPDFIRGPSRTNLIETIEKALKTPKNDWPSQRLTKSTKRVKFKEAILERIRTKRDQLAAELNIESSLIITRGNMEEIATPPHNEPSSLMPWQRALLTEVLPWNNNQPATNTQKPPQDITPDLPLFDA